MNEKLFIVIPAYNEEKNIEKTISDWYPILITNQLTNDSKLVIVDDGSTDQTADLVKQMYNDYPLITLLQKENGGHGSALMLGYNFALSNDAEWVFQTDADGQTDPHEFRLMWDSRKDYVAQFGNRTNREDGKGRVLVEKVLCLLLRIIFGVRIPDANAPFRLMSSSVLRDYLSRMPANYNLPNVMLTVFSVHDSKAIRFVPISFRPRATGGNKMNYLKIASVGYRSIADFWRFRKELRKAAN